MRLGTAATFSVITALAAPLAANPDSTNAEALFYQAKSLMAQKKLAEACAAFEASQTLKPAPTTLVSLADCREKNGQLASAYEVYQRVERELRDRSDEASVEMRGLAKLRAVKLEPRLSRLTVNVPVAAQVGGLEVLRGNDRIESAAWNQPQAVDGGTLRVSARAPDRREWSTTVTIKPEGDVQVVDVPALGERVTAPIPVAPDVVEDGVGLEGQPETVRPTFWQTNRWSLVLGGAAIALAGGAVGFELSSRSVYDRSETTTDREAQDRYWDSANRRRSIAAGLGIAAIGCAGVSLYLYIRGRHEEPRPLATRIVPVADHETAGLALFGAW